MQCESLAELGFDLGVMAVVHYERSGVAPRLDALEGLVTVETLSAELPVWSSHKIAGQISMSERSLGLRVEESFFRSQDKKYDKRGTVLA